MILRPQGQIIQDARSGYNLLPLYKYIDIGFTKTINGITITVLDEFSIKVTGKRTSNVPIDFYIFGQFTSTAEVLKLNGVYTFLISENPYTGIRAFLLHNSNICLDTNTNNKVISEELENITVSALLIRIETDNELDEIIYPMLYEGSEEKEYEEYGKMPSTNFPSPIKNVEGNYNCNIRNKNFISSNINDWEEGHYQATTGLKEPYANRLRLKELIKVQPDTAYYTNTFSNNTYNLVLREYDKYKNIINNIGGASDGGIFATTKDTKFISVSLYNRLDAGEALYFSDFKKLFEDGTIKPFFCLNSEIDKSYIESEQQIKAVELPENVKLYGKEDGFVYLTEEQVTELELDEEGWYVYNEWGEITFTGNENLIEEIGQKGDTTNLFALNNTIFTSINNYTATGAKCNYFEEATANTIWVTTSNDIKFSINVSHAIHFRTTMSLTEFKTWLEEKNTEGNPLKVVGKLVNPTYTKITDSTLISQLETLKKVFSYYPVTNIDSVSENENAPIYFNVTYFKIK